MRSPVCAFLLVAALTALWSRTAHACSCANPGAQALLKQADLVFTGEAVKAEIVDGGGVRVEGKGAASRAPAEVVTLRVHGVWKGVLPASVAVWTLARPSGMCGVDFSIGEKYLVFASRDASDPRWFAKTLLCQGTGQVREQVTRRHLEQLGPPSKTLPVEPWWGDVLDLQ